MAIAEFLIGFAQWAESTVGAYGYFGIFLVSLIGNLSVIFPIPSFAFVFAMGAVLNPWLVGLAGGAGAALGEISGYAIGKGGREIIKKKYEQALKKARDWTLKHGMFPIIIVFAATPLPSDVVGILAGMVGYDMKKFLLANFIGKWIMNTYVAFAGFYSFETILSFLGGG